MKMDGLLDRCILNDCNYCTCFFGGGRGSCLLGQHLLAKADRIPLSYAKFILERCFKRESLFFWVLKPAKKYCGDWL